MVQEAESKVVAEEPVFPPAVYLCEYKGLAQIYVLTAQARIAFLRNQTEVPPPLPAARLQLHYTRKLPSSNVTASSIPSRLGQ